MILFCPSIKHLDVGSYTDMTSGFGAEVPFPDVLCPIGKTQQSLKIAT